MKSGAINIDRYAGVEPDKQFDFLYENFSILQELLKDYREDLITEVIEQKTYNRRSQSGELGVRTQVLNAFLKKLKFSVFVKQYEMRKHFSA